MVNIDPEIFENLVTYLDYDRTWKPEDDQEAALLAQTIVQWELHKGLSEPYLMLHPKIRAMQAIFNADMNFGSCRNLLSFLKHQEAKPFSMSYYAQFLSYDFSDDDITSNFNANYAWALHADELGFEVGGNGYWVEHFVFGECYISEGFTEFDPTTGIQVMFGRLFYTAGRMYIGHLRHSQAGTSR